MKKKLQVFISSTYLDLQNERQAAVEAVLDAGHIPAGMELFRAGNESQLNVIKKWIDNSDVYMLILGGRYGSIDIKTGKSYTQIEYEYAIDKGVPVFSVILEDSFLHRKAAVTSENDVFEQQHKKQYSAFKQSVMTKVIKPAEDEKDIKLAIHATLSEFLDEYDLTGWVRNIEMKDYTDLIKENAKLTKENARLIKEVHLLKDKINIDAKNTFGEYTFAELVEQFKKKKFDLPAKYLGNVGEDIEKNALDFFYESNPYLSTGVTNSASNKEKFITYIYHYVAPFYISFGLCEKVKVAGVTWQRIQLSKDGHRFYGRLISEGVMEEEKSK